MSVHTRTGHEGRYVEQEGVMRRWATYSSLAVFVALLAAGLSLDEFRTAVANAITICLSCIGIG